MIKRKIKLTWKQDVILAGLLYIVALMILYAPVLFLGRSLQPPLYMPFGVTDHGPYGYEGRLPVANFDVDIASPAYMEWPLSRLQGELLRRGELPLWNPYQGSGTPLAAQPDSRAFFPYQIVENVMPVEAQDYFLLGRLWLAGLFTFLFLRRWHLSRESSFAGGLFYMFSGTFVIFINLEQMVNAAMVIPLFLWAIEGLWHWRWRRGVVVLAIATTLILLSGSPESAVCILLLGTAYAIFRLVTTPREYRWSIINGGLLAGTLGLILAAPMMLPLLELYPHFYTLHSPGVGVGVSNPANSTFIPQILTPILSRYPRGELYYLHGGGQWDSFGGYIGILPIYLVLAGLIFCARFKKSHLTKPLLFFAIFGLFILLKDVGFPLVSWIGHLPLMDQIWFNRWAGGTWTFSFAVAAAMGLQIIKEQEWGTPYQWQHLRRGIKWGGGVSLILLVALFAVWLNMVGNYPNYLIGMASLIILAILATALFLTHHIIRTKKGVIALVILGMIELWFAIPMGYEPGWLWLRFLPVAAGLLAIFTWFWQKRILTLGGSLLAILLVLVIDILAPSGLPQRYDPVTPPPYAQFLQERTKDYSRITGGNGVLMPNFAGLLKLYDVRYNGPVGMAWYQNLHMEHLHQERLWPYTNTALWFTGYPDMGINSQGAERIIGLNFWADLKENMRWYSLLGVRYILDEPGSSPPEDIIKNGGFETWGSGLGPFSENGPTANFWNIDLRGKSTISLIRSKSEDSNGYVMAVNYIHSEDSFVAYKVPNPELYLDSTATFSISVKTDRERAVSCVIVTGRNVSFSDFHPGDGQWHTLVATQKPAQAPLANDQLSVAVVLHDSANIYLDNAALWIGSPPPLYELGFPVIYDEEVRIFENPYAFPRAFVVHQAVYANSFIEAQQVVSQPNFNARQEAVIEETLPLPWADIANSEAATSGGLSEASIVKYQTNKVNVVAKLSQPGILVLTDTYDPGWTATMDGVYTPIYRVNGVFRGVLVPEGEHIIVFNYFPRSYVIGFSLSGLGLFICIALLCIRPSVSKNNTIAVARGKSEQG